MPQPEMDIEDDERSVKPLVLFGHHMVTDGTNPPKIRRFLEIFGPRPAGTGLLGALKTEKFKDHQLWVFSGETPGRPPGRPLDVTPEMVYRCYMDHILGFRFGEGSHLS